MLTDHPLSWHRHSWRLCSSHWLVGHHKYLLDKKCARFQETVKKEQGHGITWPGPAPTIGALLAIGGAGPGVGGAVEGGACHVLFHFGQ